MKIKKATISPLPKSILEPLPIVMVTLEDNRKEELFSYYPDEITFQPEEFVGLTVKQAHELKTKKDIAYLKS